MNFTFELASSKHVSEIMDLMHYAKDTVTKKEWFVDDDEPFVRSLLEGKGFIILARPENSRQLAGFFFVKFVGDAPDSLARFSDLSAEKLPYCAHMDSAAVYPEFRGHHLQAQMTAEAEKQLLQTPYRYLFATIHPDNLFSLNNMRSMGYEVINRVRIYGGLDRYVIFKELT